MSVTYDIVLSSPFPNYHFFAHRMRELCGQLNLTFFMADQVWVGDFLRKLGQREIGVRMLLDLSASQTEPEDPHLLLAREVKRQRGYVIDDPDITATAAHKGKFHQLLLENHIPVPETVIVSRGEIDRFRVTDDIKAQVGVPFVVKPAWGDSGVGVIVNGHSEFRLAAICGASPELRLLPDSTVARTERTGRPFGLVPHVPHLPGGNTLLVEPLQPRIPVGYTRTDKTLYAGSAQTHHERHRPGLQNEEVHIRDLSASGRQILCRGLP